MATRTLHSRSNRHTRHQLHTRNHHRNSHSTNLGNSHAQHNQPPLHRRNNNPATPPRIRQQPRLDEHHTAFPNSRPTNQHQPDHRPNAHHSNSTLRTIRHNPNTLRKLLNGNNRNHLRTAAYNRTLPANSQRNPTSQPRRYRRFRHSCRLRLLNTLQHTPRTNTRPSQSLNRLTTSKQATETIKFSPTNTLHPCAS